MGNHEMAVRSTQLSQLFTKNMNWKYSNFDTSVSHVVDQPNKRTPRGDILMSEQLIFYQQGVGGESVGSFLHRSNPREAAQ